MSNQKQLFEVETVSLMKMIDEYGNAWGYVIPDYQREFDWEKSNIERLYFDVMNGLFRLGKSETNSHKFLGAIILAEQASEESDFKGTSFEVIDGQQRLTTLLLLTCALCEELTLSKTNIDSESMLKSVADWLDDEVEHWVRILYLFAVGCSVKVIEENPFARIIRDGDRRRDSDQNSLYVSPIACFLDEYRKFHVSLDSESDSDCKSKLGLSDYFTRPDLGASQSADVLWEKYVHIRELIGKISEEQEDCEIFEINDIVKVDCSSLFLRIDEHFDPREQGEMLDDIRAKDELHELIRLLLFTSYL